MSVSPTPLGNLQVQDHLSPVPDGQTWHPPRPDAELRFYSVTVGRKPGVYVGTDDWRSQVANVPGAAVLSFDSLAEAEKAYKQALTQDLVVQVQTIGERHILTHEDAPQIPGMNISGPNDGKWYTLTVGTEPGLYPAMQNVTPLTSNVSGACCKKWGSYELAYKAFNEELTNGLVVKDNRKIIRTPLSG